MLQSWKMPGMVKLMLSHLPVSLVNRFSSPSLQRLHVSAQNSFPMELTSHTPKSDGANWEVTSQDDPSDPHMTQGPKGLPGRLPTMNSTPVWDSLPRIP